MNRLSQRAYTHVDCGDEVASVVLLAFRNLFMVTRSGEITMICYNATSNSASNATADPRIVNAESLALYRLYIYASVPAVVANIVCIAVRSRYYLTAYKLND